MLAFFAEKNVLHYFSYFFLISFNKNISVLYYKVVKHLTSWPVNELVKQLTMVMVWTTGPSICFSFVWWQIDKDVESLDIRINRLQPKYVRPARHASPFLRCFWFPWETWHQTTITCFLSVSLLLSTQFRENIVARQTGHIINFIRNRSSYTRCYL